MKENNITIDLLHSWGKPAAFNYTWLTLEMVLIMTLATVKRPSDMNQLKITPRAMQIAT